MVVLQLKWYFAVVFFLFMSAPLAAASTKALEYHQQQVVIGDIERTVIVPLGYSLELLVDGLGGPRLPTFHRNGDLFIGSKSGDIYRLPPPYTHADVLLKLEDYPHSVAFRDDEILIAQTRGLYWAPYRAGQKRIAKSSVTLLVALPGGPGHNSRTVRVGPDGRVYLGFGIAGNCSDQYLGSNYPFEDRRGGVLVLHEADNEVHWETYASGLRNSVGFDWHPKTGTLYATNNGPDHLGFELPPEYFSRLEPNSFHGMPWYQYDGKTIKRDVCIPSEPPRPLSKVVMPVVTFPARNAPLGMAFVPEGAMDEQLTGDAIVALHGSWATRPSIIWKIGERLGLRKFLEETFPTFDPKATRRPPKVVIVRFKNGEAQRVDDLITGFQSSTGERWARPAGVAIGPDNALYFTSDSGVHALFRLKRIQ